MHISRNRSYPVVFRLYHDPVNDLYYPYLDLFLHFAYKFPMNEKDSSGSGILKGVITEKMAKSEGIKKAELFRNAYVNTRFGSLPVLEKMDSFLGVPLKPEAVFFRLINPDLGFGGVYLFFPDLFKELCERERRPVLIIPASVHELILIFLKDRIPKKDSRPFMREMNARLDPEEILSDHLYFYDPGDEKIDIWE